jgi:hypothetical protein
MEDYFDYISINSDTPDFHSIEVFTGSDDRPYEWRLEMRNMRKVR